MFAGILSFQQSISAWGMPEKILSALAPYSFDKPRDVWKTEQQLLVQVDTKTGALSAAIYQHLESGIAVAFWGRLDNRPDLIAQLDAKHNASDDELIALAWLKWGEYCPEKLVGDFAFAVASPKTGVVFLARDVMGVKPLYYRSDEHGVFFANSAAAFKPLKLGTLTPSKEWIAKFILEFSYSHTDTAYEEIKKLPGAHSLLIHADGRTNLRRYHQFVDDAPFENKRNQHWLEQYQSVWHEAVACRMPKSGMIGTENSGGLDSGSITAEIARQLGKQHLPKRLFGFGFAFDALEPEYIMEVARHCEITNTYLMTGLDVEPPEGWVQYELNISGFPNEHPNGTSHTAFYRECRIHNISTLFSGFGGDEAVTSSSIAPRYDLLQRKQLRNLWQVFPGYWHHKLGRLALTLWRNSLPINNIQLKNKAQIAKTWQNSFFSDDAMDRYQLLEVILEGIPNATRYTHINDQALEILDHPFMSARLANCSQMASAYGVEYVWPLLDQRLIQQWLSTPAIWKLGPNGVTRYLHKRAVADVGPEKMVWKQGKDMGMAPVNSFWAQQEEAVLMNKINELSINASPLLWEIINLNKLSAFIKQGLQENKKKSDYAVLLDSVFSNIDTINLWLGK